MSDWRPVEIFGTFLRLSGEIEVPRPQRLGDVVNHVADHLELRALSTEPLAAAHPVLSRAQERATVAKRAITLLCPREPVPDPPDEGALRRPRERVSMAITTAAWSMIADVHLEPRHTLRDQLERYPEDFLALTNLSALWVAGLGERTHAIQRAFALLNPATILCFGERP